MAESIYVTCCREDPNYHLRWHIHSRLVLVYLTNGDQLCGKVLQNRPGHRGMAAVVGIPQPLHACARWRDLSISAGT
jgi:hypothetical protein